MSMFVRLLIVCALPLSLVSRAADLVNDKAITIHSSADIQETRKKLIEYLWDQAGFPSPDRFPNRVVTNIASPVHLLEHLRRVDELRMDLTPGLEALAYHFIAKNPKPEVVILHHGHACTLDDEASAKDVGYGMQRTINSLLGEGYGVMGVFMPHMRPGDCTGNHEAMFELKTTGSPLKYFLEPTVISLNYALNAKRSETDDFPQYRKAHMAGLSGGGWTTTVCAAIDHRIQCSFPVAGTIPLYLRSGGSIGDREQFEPPFYSLAGYQDLYVLGASGAQRRQVQILVRKDDCCFGEAQHDRKATGMEYTEAMRSYEKRVQAALKGIGEGSFRLKIDETAPSHMISHHAIDLILQTLRSSGD